MKDSASKKRTKSNLYMTSCVSGGGWGGRRCRQNKETLSDTRPLLLWKQLQGWMECQLPPAPPREASSMISTGPSRGTGKSHRLCPREGPWRGYWDPTACPKWEENVTAERSVHPTLPAATSQSLSFPSFRN